ncbi:sugar ABC transporter permease [Alloalcanivorax gelatiniphagus]
MTTQQHQATPAPPGTAPKGRLGVYQAPRTTRKAQARLGALMVLPLVLLMATFLVFPMLNAIYYVFVDFDGIDQTPPWVGLDNFRELASDPNLWPALKNNLIWIIVGTAAPLVLGFALALALWEVKRPGIWYRLAFFLPYVLPPVAVAVVWGWIYEPSRGWLNRALEAVGLGSLRHGWLGDPDTALYAVLGTAVWTAVGFVFVILLSALRNVDVDLMDAARLDGAGYLQRVRYVVLPQIMPVFLMVTTVTLLGGFSVFEFIFVMTGGGPAGATDVLGTYAYASAFQLNRISYGTTLAMVITVLAVPVAIGLNRLQRRVSVQGTSA